MSKVTPTASKVETVSQATGGWSEPVSKKLLVDQSDHPILGQIHRIRDYQMSLFIWHLPMWITCCCFGYGPWKALALSDWRHQLVLVALAGITVGLAWGFDTSEGLLDPYYNLIQLCESSLRPLIGFTLAGFLARVVTLHSQRKAAYQAFYLTCRNNIHAFGVVLPDNAYRKEWCALIQLLFEATIQVSRGYELHNTDACTISIDTLRASDPAVCIDKYLDKLPTDQNNWILTICLWIKVQWSIIEKRGFMSDSVGAATKGLYDQLVATSIGLPTEGTKFPFVYTWIVNFLVKMYSIFFACHFGMQFAIRRDSFTDTDKIVLSILLVIFISVISCLYEALFDTANLLSRLYTGAVEGAPHEVHSRELKELVKSLDAIHGLGMPAFDDPLASDPAHQPKDPPQRVHTCAF